MKINNPSHPAPVKIYGKHFESKDAQQKYIQDVAEGNSRFEDWDSSYDFIKGFRGRGAELGAIAGACSGGAFTAYKCLESVLTSATTGGELVGGLILGGALTVGGFWAGCAAGGAVGYGLGWTIDKSSQALGAPEVWFKNG